MDDVKVITDEIHLQTGADHQVIARIISEIKMLRIEADQTTIDIHPTRIPTIVDTLKVEIVDCHHDDLAQGNEVIFRAFHQHQRVDSVKTSRKPNVSSCWRSGERIIARLART